MNKTKVLFVYLFMSLAAVSCAKETPIEEGRNYATDQPLPQSLFLTHRENCKNISNSEKTNPLVKPSRFYDFYTLAEDTTRFKIAKSQSVYVVGDIHGSWEVIFRTLINSGIMEFDTPNQKVVSIKYKGADINVSIPSLKFAAAPRNKVIFVGDYIAKTTPEREQRTLALLTDILTKQKLIGEQHVVATLGNHDLEAVNGVVHSGYAREKNYLDQVMFMVRNDLLVPTFYYNGIWYSHSYLTPDDVREVVKMGFHFHNPPQASQDVNAYIVDLITHQNVSTSTWLSSYATHFRQTGPFNFFYAMTALAADGSSDITFDKFPIIMGHLSDTSRKVPRVLTETVGGVQKKYLLNRAHILCIDTSIYHSTQTGADATFLRINYDSVAGKAEFQSCAVSTQ